MNFMQQRNFKKEKQFGWLIAGLLLAVYLFKYFKTSEIILFPIAVSGILFILSFVYPASLKYPLIIWEKVRFCLALINTVLLLSVVYFLIFLPLGLLFRLTGRDLLNIRTTKTQTSYWEPAEEKPASFKFQF